MFFKFVKKCMFIYQNMRGDCACAAYPAGWGCSLLEETAVPNWVRPLHFAGETCTKYGYPRGADRCMPLFP